MRRQSGFTMIELVLVITIVAILAVSAFPMFIDVSTEAQIANMRGVTGAIKSGIIMYRAEQIVETGGGSGGYPATLDSATVGEDCSTTNLCFTTVLVNGIIDANWSKTAADKYVFDDGTSTYTYTYNSTNGTFITTDIEE